VQRNIRVLVIDDSALVRRILTEGLTQDPHIEVVGSAPDPYVAREEIARTRPDVLTLDVEMPRMDGVQFLRHLMPQYPLPTIMVSAVTERGRTITMQALEAGAVDFVQKPSADTRQSMESVLAELRQKVKTAATIDVSHWKGRRPTTAVATPSPASRTIPINVNLANKIIAIGASTGGVEAINQVISRLPATLPGIVIVQHMPAGFTNTFARRLNELTQMHVAEAASGSVIQPGHVYLAPGDEHLRVRRVSGQLQVECSTGEKVCGHRPSVEVLFRSVAQVLGAQAIGVMLTGMGSDGADGMVAMRQAGARTLAQDQKSSVVFGMPAEAFRRGGAEKLVPLDQIANQVVHLLQSMK
jgi:two-component system chemotaxis response regulator CheB